MDRMLFSIHDLESGAWTELISANSLNEVVTQLRRSPDNHVYKHYADQFELVYLGNFVSTEENAGISVVEPDFISFSTIFSGKNTTLTPEVKTDE